MSTHVRFLAICFISIVGTFANNNAFSVEIDRVHQIRELPQTGFMREIISFNNKAFFLYELPRGLWQSDGAAAGTNVMKSIPDGMNCGFITKRWGSDYTLSQSSVPIVLNGHFFFYVLNYSGEGEVWKSDGTAGGTTLFKQTGYGDFNSFTMIQNIMYLLSDQALWRSDGSSAGTWKVASLINASGLIALNGSLFFAASDLTHDSELWISDGTAAGTKLFVDIKPFDTTFPCGEEYCTDSSSSPTNQIVHRNKLYFSADDGTHGRELWKTDGTAVGTRMVDDIRPGPEGAYVNNPVIVGEFLLFSAYDDAYGKELWRTDGTSNGTFLLADLDPGASGSHALSYLAARLNNELYFTTWNNLWKTDGTSNGTKLVKNTLRHSYVGSTSAVLGNRLYFCGGLGDNNDELWVTDGTSEGTRMVMDIFPGINTYGNYYSSIPRNFVTVGDIILFNADYDALTTPGGYTGYRNGLFRIERSPMSILPFLQPLLLEHK